MSTEKKTEKVQQWKQQVRETFKKAFFNLLEQKVSSKPPDYEWLTRLYAEIKEKLMALLKKDSDVRNEINESMDTELFMQMISNDAFSISDFYKLITYVFAKCVQLQAPFRDEKTNEKLLEIIEHINSGDAVFSTIVPLFIKNANYCIDNIYEDMKNIKKNIQKNITQQ